jgi:hypothetical protein
MDEVKALTVGQLREAIANLPDYVEVVIDTDGWYDNVREIIVPMPEVDDSEYVCLTLIPSSMTNPETRHGDWDCRQNGYAPPAEVTLSGEAP